MKYIGIESNLFRAMLPAKGGWTEQNMLLADIADSLHWLAWAKTKDGHRGRNRPQPIPRPGFIDEPRAGAKPKASPLSVIRERFKRRYNRDEPPDRTDKLKTLLK